MKAMPLLLGMGAVLVAAALPPARAAAVATEVELGPAQLREQLARPAMKLFAAHAVPFEGSRHFLVRGTRAADGSCRFTETLRGKIGELSALRSLGSIDLAVHASRCEKVVERGIYAVAPDAAPVAGPLAQGGALPAPARPAALGDWQQSASYPLAGKAESEVPALAQPEADAALLRSAGIETEWNYGNMPALAAQGRELITSAIDSTAQVPSNVCQVGGQYGWSTKYTFNPLLGYIIDTGYPNRAEISVYCHSVCTTTSCRYDWGYVENRGYYRVRNPGLLGTDGPSTIVPLCVNPISNTYAPNRIRVYTDGRYEATVNTYWTGWSVGCGEYLQKFSRVHSP